MTKGSWTCAVCDEENRPEWDRCVYCNRPRGTWICPRCAGKNRKQDVACRACGGNKQLAPPSTG